MKNLHLLGAALVSAGILLMTTSWSLSVLGEEPPAPADVVLPAPTGPFSVGRSIYEWTDASRDEVFSDVDGERRSLVVWIWYPAQDSAAPPSDYMPGTLGTQIEAAIGLPSGLIRVPTQDDVAILDGDAPYPVLVFSHGSGSILAIYTAMLAEIASHGYVVVGVQHPYNALLTTFVDGRTIPTSPKTATDDVQYWSEDMAFVVNELDRISAESSKFAGQLDLSRLGVFATPRVALPPPNSASTTRVASPASTSTDRFRVMSRKSAPPSRSCRCFPKPHARMSPALGL